MQPLSKLSGLVPQNGYEIGRRVMNRESGCFWENRILESKNIFTTLLAVHGKVG